MKIVKQSCEFLWITPNPLQTIERAGRTCYKSLVEERITPDSASKFVEMLLKRGHEAMIEHALMSYRVVCDRGVSHEIVRHRLFSYAQESTRYCNYGKAGEIGVICPPGLTDAEQGTYSFDFDLWRHAVEAAEGDYLALVENGVHPQIARSVLPTCLKTEVVITGNFREWRHFFKLRTAKEAHPQMQEIANLILSDARLRVTVVFDELGN